MQLDQGCLRTEADMPALALAGKQAAMAAAIPAVRGRVDGLVGRAALEAQGMEAMVAMVGQEALEGDHPSEATMEARLEVRQAVMAKVDGTVTNLRKEKEKAKETVSRGAARAGIRRALTHQVVLAEVRIGMTGPVRPARVRLDRIG